MEGATTTDQGEITFEYYSPLCSLVHRDRIKYTFIAADCGDQPRTEAEEIRKALHPPDNTVWYTVSGYKHRNDIEGSCGGLERCEYSITDNLATRPGSGGRRCSIPEYNCIAYSVDETNAWYNDYDIARDYGDKDGSFELTDMDDFYFKKKGWMPFTFGTDEQKAAHGRGDLLFWLSCCKEKILRLRNGQVDNV
jgi:hypothetical protein